MSSRSGAARKKLATGQTQSTPLLPFLKSSKAKKDKEKGKLQLHYEASISVTSLPPEARIINPYEYENASEAYSVVTQTPSPDSALPPHMQQQQQQHLQSQYGITSKHSRATFSSEAPTLVTQQGYGYAIGKQAQMQKAYPSHLSSLSASSAASDPQSPGSPPVSAGMLKSNSLNHSFHQQTPAQAQAHAYRAYANGNSNNFQPEPIEYLPQLPLPLPPMTPGRARNASATPSDLSGIPPSYHTQADPTHIPTRTHTLLTQRSVPSPQQQALVGRSDASSSPASQRIVEYDQYGNPQAGNRPPVISGGRPAPAAGVVYAPRSVPVPNVLGPRPRTAAAAAATSPSDVPSHSVSPASFNGSQYDTSSSAYGSSPVPSSSRHGGVDNQYLAPGSGVGMYTSTSANHSPNGSLHAFHQMQQQQSSHHTASQLAYDSASISSRGSLSRSAGIVSALSAATSGSAGVQAMGGANRHGGGSNRNGSASLHSTSSGGSGNGSTKSYVVPLGGGRSRAIPRAAREGTSPKFSFKKKNNKAKGKERPNYPQATRTLTAPPILQISSGSGSGGRSSGSGDGTISPTSEAGVSFSIPPQLPGRSGRSFSESSRSPGSASINSASSPPPSSAGSSSSNERPKMIYPSSRSRATPKVKEKKTEGSSGGSISDGDSSGKQMRTKFMGISLGKKKSTSGGMISSAIPEQPEWEEVTVQVDGEGGGYPQDIYGPGLSEEEGTGTPMHNQNDTLVVNNGGHPQLVQSPESAEFSDLAGYLHTQQHQQSIGDDYSPVGSQEFDPRGALGVGRTARLDAYTKVGTYPLDPYDSTMLESDRLTHDLLKKLNPTGSPSFYPYGTMPPATVLDLGCGQGHWILDAAVAWKGYGTRVTGVDMVDVAKNLRNMAARHGVADNVQFVKSNFLKKQLPFPDESFDLVRMSCLTFSVSYDKWEYVLSEVRRVLTVGGRLELIDDHIFFAYGKPPALALPPPTPASNSNSSSGEHGDHYYDDIDDAATLNGAADPPPSRARFPGMRRDSYASTATTQPAPTVSMIMSIEPDEWAENAASSKQLESLFEHMLNVKYGIHLCPSEFAVDLFRRLFGHSREMETFHLTFAPPNAKSRESSLPGKAGTSSALAGPQDDDFDYTDFNPLLQSPGLMVWPSRFIRFPQQEVEAHALKHSKVLLACKTMLAEYALEITDDEDVDEDGVNEALWDYSGFLERRFNPPPGTNLDGAPVDDLNDEEQDDVASLRNVSGTVRRQTPDGNSVYSVGSDQQSAMYDYQSDFRQHFNMIASAGQPSPALPSMTRPPTAGGGRPLPDPSKQQELLGGSATQGSPAISAQQPPSFTSHARPDENPRHSVAAPPTYSRYEPTHIRTFHVFEAIKMPPSESSDEEEVGEEERYDDE